MTVGIVVPFLPDGGWRDLAWAWVKRRYEKLHPDWEIVEGLVTGAWSKGLAVADGLSRSQADVVVVADADSFCSAQVITEAALLAEDAPWVVPHRWVYRLTREATRQRLQSGPVDTLGPCRVWRHLGPIGGGIVVARRDVIDRVPFDPRFFGWGGDDVSFGRALDTLAGPHVQMDGTLWHLWHPPQPTSHDALPESEHLGGRYMEAAGDISAMQAIIDEIDR